MKRRIVLIILAVAASCVSADFLDKYISFTEAEIQAALDKSSHVDVRYGSLMTFTLLQTPKITLGNPEERVGVTASMSISLGGGAPVPLDVAGMAGIRYDDKAKAFYLEKPVATSVRSPALSSDEANALRGAATQLIAAYFRSRPVYVLREDGNAQERAARWLLRAIRIEPGKVVATLSPF
ncbi:MAG: DUF1439 domain-containing protein [Azonexus sp.]|jgi:hypothetical protein